MKATYILGQHKNRKLNQPKGLKGGRPCAPPHLAGVCPLLVAFGTVLARLAVLILQALHTLPLLPGLRGLPPAATAPI